MLVISNPAVAKIASNEVALGRDRVRFFIEVVPVAAPIFMAVATPPMLTVPAVVLKRFPVAFEAVRLPLFTATAPEVVILPLLPVIE